MFLQKIHSIKQSNAYQIALHNILWGHYLSVAKEEPKDPSMSKSLYLTCLSIRVLEKMGNTYPSQDEIDAVETLIKRFQRNSAIKSQNAEVSLKPSHKEVLSVAA